MGSYNSDFYDHASDVFKILMRAIIITDAAVKKAIPNCHLQCAVIPGKKQPQFFTVTAKADFETTASKSDQKNSILLLNEFNAELLGRRVQVSRLEKPHSDACGDVINPIMVEYFATDSTKWNGWAYADVYYSEIGNPKAIIATFPKKLVGEHIMTFLTTGNLLDHPLVSDPS